jgi:hypothetical protein
MWSLHDTRNLRFLVEDEKMESIRIGMGKDNRTIKDYGMRNEVPNVIIFICEMGGLILKIR